MRGEPDDEMELGVTMFAFPRSGPDVGGGGRGGKEWTIVRQKEQLMGCATARREDRGSPDFNGVARISNEAGS